MLTLNEGLERLRRDLGDTDPANRAWSTEDLERHLRHALRDIARRLPREMKTALQTTPGSREISLAPLSNLVQVRGVEWPVGQFPPAYTRWSVWDGVLTLLDGGEPLSAEAVNVYWHANHTLDPAGTTLPEALEELVVLGALGYATQEAALRGTNAMNAGGPAVVERYGMQSRLALREFRETLQRTGPQGSLRATSLYTAAGSLPTQSTDPGP